jgi:CRP-like cAMP-binding protein
MQGQPLLDFLKSTELLCELPDEALPAIAAQVEVMQLNLGDELFREGEMGDAAYLIVDGEIAMVSDGVELVRRGRGGCVGEFSLLDDEPRSATVVARSPARLLRWRRDRFLTALATDREMGRSLIRMLTRKLRGDVERGVDLLMERERWRQDLSRSREIQSGMLPAERLSLNGLELAARCTPAADVGGDFYDYLALPDGEVAVAIGDVTGHGFYSGLFVAMAKSCLHTQTRFDHDPRSVMEALRRAMELSLQRRLLMSCAYFIVNPQQQTLRCANAGHPNPMLRRAATGDVVELPVLDPILGALDVGERPFRVQDHPFRPGDAFMLFSDGITETRSPGGEEFGFERLRQVFSSHADGPPHLTRNAVVDAVIEHAAGAAQLDDLTLVVVRHGGDAAVAA